MRDPMESMEEMKKRLGLRARKKDLEAAVLRECLHFLRLHERVVYIERRNTGAVQFEDGGFLKFGARGAADIWCLMERSVSVHVFCERGRQHNVKIDVLTHVEIECKRRDGKGRLSDKQREFKAFCEQQGIPYFVVTSVEDLSNQLHNFGLTA